MKSLRVSLQITPSADQVYADGPIQTNADLAGRTIAVFAGDAPPPRSRPSSSGPAFRRTMVLRTSPPACRRHRGRLLLRGGAVNLLDADIAFLRLDQHSILDQPTLATHRLVRCAQRQEPCDISTRR